MHSSCIGTLCRNVKHNGSFLTILSRQQRLWSVAGSCSNFDATIDRVVSSETPTVCFESTKSAYLRGPLTLKASFNVTRRWLSDRGAKRQPKTNKMGKKKPSGKGGGGASAAAESVRSRDLDLILAALDAPTRVEPPVPEEETRIRHEIGRNYVIGRFREHNEMHHDLTCKLHMKRHALNMLPRGSRLREAALELDDSQVAPLWRHIAVWTPPIPGFNPTEFADQLR